MSAMKDAGERSVVVVGAGIGGLAFAIALKQQLKCEDFTIYDQGFDVGGTWRDNTYPGCASDIPTHWYCLSSELKADWSKTVVPQAELQAYWQGLTSKHGLYEHTVFHTKVVAAEWDIERQMYDVTLQDVRTGEQSSVRSKVVVSAIGIFPEPRYPSDVKGIDSFKGTYFHSAKWDHGVDLRGKRVAVIGNGCSAVQLVPKISEDPTTQVVNFCRTPSWFLPVGNADYSGVVKWIFAHVPLAMRTHRWWFYIRHEIIWAMVTRGKNNMFRQMLMHFLRAYMRNVAPEKYHDRVIPSYPLGCKRIVFDTKYLPALHRPNLDLNWDGVSSIVEDGVLTKTCETIPFDVIVFATGFVVDEFPFLVRGKDGETIQKYFQEQQAPTAYFGTTVPGFPNFYTIAGPNTATGHASVIFVEEVQINYMLQLIKPVVERRLSSFEVTHAATDKFNRELERRLFPSVWSQCSSWYRTAGQKGRPSAIWPGSATEYWWRMRSPRWSDYLTVAGEKWRGDRRRAALRRTVVGVLAVAAAVAWGATHQDLVLDIWSQVWAQASDHWDHIRHISREL